MKLKAPDDIKNVACDDKEYPVGKDGTVEVPENLVEKFLILGFSHVPTDEKKKSKTKDE